MITVAHTCSAPLIAFDNIYTVCEICLSIAINRAKPVCAIVIIKHNYIHVHMGEHKLIIITMLCFFVKLYRTCVSQDLLVHSVTQPYDI